MSDPIATMEIVDVYPRRRGVIPKQEVSTATVVEPEEPKEPERCSGYYCHGGPKTAILAWGIIIVTLILCAILIPLSFDKVSVGQIALDEDVHGNVDENSEPVGNGYYYVGLGNSKYRVKHRYRIIRETAAVFVGDNGAEVPMHVTALARINKKHLGLVYSRYKGDYWKRMRSKVIAAVKRVKGPGGDNLIPEDFVIHRTHLLNEIKRLIKEDLEPQGFEFFDEFFSFNATIPPHVQSTALRQVVNNLRADVVEAEAQVNLIRATTAREVGAINANRTALRRTTDTQVESIQVRADAEVNEIEGSALGLGINAIFNVTNATSALERSLIIRYLNQRRVLE